MDLRAISLCETCCGFPCLRRDIALAFTVALPGERHWKGSARLPPIASSFWPLTLRGDLHKRLHHGAQLRSPVTGPWRCAAGAARRRCSEPAGDRSGPSTGGQAIDAHSECPPANPLLRVPSEPMEPGFFCCCFFWWMVFGALSVAPAG